MFASSRVHSASLLSSLLIPMDGCIFRSIARALGRDFVVFVGEMKRFAREYLQSADNTAFLNDVQLWCGLWSLLNPKDKRTVQAFWSAEDTDVLIPMIAAYLNQDSAVATQIRVWRIEDGELKRSNFVYPTEEGSFTRMIDLFKSNMILEHYDLMRKK